MQIPQSASRSFEKPIPIVYQDDDYVVFDKPSGIIVVPSPRGEKNTLVNIVNHQYAKAPSEPGLYPCHRLDQQTSGLIVFAKGKKKQQLFMDLFKMRQVKKKYIAFVYGKLRQSYGELRSKIQSIEDRKYHGEDFVKNAVTRYKVLGFKRGFTVVEVEPLTGRTNQIRIHFSQIGHPLVGERKYALGKENPFHFRRIALHAAEIEFRHPISKKTLNISIDLPKDMEELSANH